MISDEVQKHRTACLEYANAALVQAESGSIRYADMFADQAADARAKAMALGDSEQWGRDMAGWVRQARRRIHEVRSPEQ